MRDGVHRVVRQPVISNFLVLRIGPEHCSPWAQRSLKAGGFGNEKAPRSNHKVAPSRLHLQVGPARHGAKARPVRVCAFSLWAHSPSGPGEAWVRQAHLGLRIRRRRLQARRAGSASHIWLKRTF